MHTYAIALTGRHLNQPPASSPDLSWFSDTTSASISPVERRERVISSAAANAAALRARGLREDAQRPLSVNLSEGIALSHKLLRFTGAALKN